MADLTDYVDPIAAAIFEKYEERGKTEQARTYLGASVIGAECSRALWYGFRWAAREQFDGRTLRLLKKKHMTTDELCAELRTARSTLMVAITRMRAEGIVCIAAWRYTGSSPAKLWGLGSVDAPRPRPQTKEERNAIRNAARRIEREKDRPFVPPEPKKSTARRDIAASWF